MLASLITHAAARRHWLLWLIAFIPALVALHIAHEYGQTSPHFDTWAFVQEYKDWHEGAMPWQHFFTPHNEHPSAVGKAVFFFVMEKMRGDVSLLPLLTWLFVFIASLCVVRLSASLWKGSLLRGPALALLVNMSLFTMAHVESWTWEFLFQNFIPGTCLALGLLCLAGSTRFVLRLFFALLLSVIANHSCGTGFLVWVLLLPMLWLATKGRQRWGILAAWCVVNGYSMHIALHGLTGSHALSSSTNGKISLLLSQPWMTWRYVTLLLGYPLANGTAVDSMVLGPLVGTLFLFAALAALWAIITSPVSRAKVREWLPLLLLGSYSLLAAGLICVGRMRQSLLSACAYRYVAFTLFFIPVVLLLLLYAYDNALTDERRSQWRTKLARVAMICLGAMLVLQGLNWQSGYNAIRIFDSKFLSERACLRFLDVVPIQHTPVIAVFDAADVASLTRYLRANGKIRHMDPAPGTDISEYKRSHAIDAGRGEVSLSEDFSRHAFTIKGRAEISDTDTPPHAVLITRVTEGDKASEQVVTILPIDSWPTDFFDDAWRRKLYPEHYFGFEMTLPNECLDRLGKGESKLRAYAFEQHGGRVYRIAGDMILPAR